MPMPEPELLAKPVSPEAALAFWQAKVPMTREQAIALGERERWRAFYVAGLCRLDQIQSVHAALGEALKNGESLADFQGRIGTVIDSEGWNSYRVENIFRTNMQTAYSAGRYTKMQEVKQARPYWQYITVEDKRRRPSHAVLHGLVYPADHDFWGTNYPPNGFRCRCCVRSLSERQVKKLGLTVQSEMPGDSQWTDPKNGMEYHVARPGADDGFRNNPGKDWMESLLTVAADKLESAAPPVATAAVRMLAHGGFADWAKKPEGNFPLAVLKKEDASSMGSRVSVAKISPATYAKQMKHHPELTTSDYLLAQDAVEYGEKYKQDARNMAFILNQPGGVVVIVKATQIGDELYVTSLRRLSRDDAKRARIIEQLKKK